MADGDKESTPQNNASRSLTCVSLSVSEPALIWTNPPWERPWPARNGGTARSSKLSILTPVALSRSPFARVQSLLTTKSDSLGLRA
jgi:hypothetical protein